METQPTPSTTSSTGNGFPVLAIAVLGIMAACFLLITYYIFITKCCFSMQQLDPLRRFSFRRTQPVDQDFLMMAYSPGYIRRGLDETLIRDIPTFQYHVGEDGETGEKGSSLLKCVVCLADFQDQEMLRVLPKCSHAFHSDCIDIWLQNNTNCPLCRTSIFGENRDHHRNHPLDAMPAPNSSPQDARIMANEEDFVVIEVTGAEEERIQESRGSLLQRQQERSDSSRMILSTKRKNGKSHHASIMGDECINVREKDDDQFFSAIQPIRRSFSMDSAADRHVYVSVQEILRQNRNHITEECSSRSQRSIFSFGQNRGSKRAVIPIEKL